MPTDRQTRNASDRAGTDTGDDSIAEETIREDNVEAETDPTTRASDFPKSDVNTTQPATQDIQDILDAVNNPFARVSKGSSGERSSALTDKQLDEALNITGNLLNAASEFPNVRMAAGVENRDKQIMTWRLPSGSMVQMYMNPQSFNVKESKTINSVRTKGGFVVQYWGDNLTELSLSGTTGSSGVKGINVLRDIYRSENIAFDTIANSQVNDVFTALSNGRLEDQQIGDALIGYVDKTLRSRNFILRPTLAALAAGVTLFYQGIQYKGYFTSFSVKESVDPLGQFNYDMIFMVTETRGVRENFMPWHREPLADDPTGQFLNAVIGGIGSSLRSAVGLSNQPSTPTAFHPENAPLSFGGNSLASQFGVDVSGPFGVGKR